MTSDELLTQAITAFQNGELDEAERHFRALLRIEPKHLAGLNLLGVVLTASRKFHEAETTIKAALAVNDTSDATHHNYGLVLRALGRPAEALTSFGKAIAINPAVADSYAMRGAVLNDLGRPDEAIIAADKALHLDANAAEAWYARGVACNMLRRPQEAADAFNRAIAINPNFAQAWLGIAGILALAKQSEDALTAHERAIALNADLPEAWLGRALALAQMKRKDEAIAAYRDAIKHGIDAEQVNYHLAAMGAEPPPAALPPAQVATTFDQYAETFDKHLTEVLKYDIPAQAAAAIKRAVTKTDLDILDLGCGTGLSGEHLVDVKRTMVGVDLSPKMLDKARARGIYDDLVCGELVAFLAPKQAAYDVVIAADVFVYIGDLAPVFRGVRRALRDGGLFCFSIEAAEERDFVVRETFRFAHSAAYIERLAAETGFAVTGMTPVVVRQDGDTRINGYLALLRAGT